MKQVLALFIVCACLCGCAEQKNRDAEADWIFVRCQVPTTLELGEWRLFSSAGPENTGRESGRLQAWRGSAVIDIRSARTLASLLHGQPTAALAHEFYDLVDRFVLDEGIANELWSTAVHVSDRGISPEEERPRRWVRVVTEQPGFVELDRQATSWNVWAHVRVKLGAGRYEIEPWVEQDK